MTAHLTDRREYSGGAVQQTTTTDMTNTSMVVNIDASTNWPTAAAAAGGFYVLIAEGTAAEEKMLVSGRTANQLTISARGADGSTAFAHPAGAKIRCWYAAKDADEANYHTSNANDVHGVAGNVLGDLDVQAVYNKSFDGTNAFLDYTLSPHDHSNAAGGGAIAHGPLTPLVFSSGWANVGGGEAAGGYRVDAKNYVGLQGLVKSTGAAGNAPFATALPAALDGANHYFPVYNTTSGTWILFELSGTTLTALGAVNGASYTLDDVGYQA